MYNVYLYWYNLDNTGVWGYMARTLQQIIAELNPTFQPQVQSLEQRAQLLPQQIESEEAGLGAKKDQAYEDIVSGARRRGLGFAGIPLGEQAKYAATDYAPALARLRQSGQERAFSLQDAILGINERRDTLAQQLYGQDLDRDAQEKAARAAAAAAANPSFGNLFAGAGGNAGAAGAPRIEKSDRGFAFYDPSGKPINAVQYASLKGLPLRTLLTNMANDGDTNARIGLQYLTNNGGAFGAAPQQYRGALGALGATNFSNGLSDLSKGVGLTDRQTGTTFNLPGIMNGRY